MMAVIRYDVEDTEIFQWGEIVVIFLSQFKNDQAF